MSAKIFYFPHPFTNERHEESIESGISLESIVKKSFHSAVQGLSVRTIINGSLVPMDKRSSTIIKDDDEIIVRIVPTDAGSQRENVSLWTSIGTIALFALSVVAAIVIPGAGWVAVVGFGLAFFGQVTSGLTAAGVIGTFSDEQTTKTHPSLHGASNGSNPNGKVPLVLGTHLYTPGYLSPAYTEISGTDGIDQYLHMAYILGYGPLKVSNIKLGDTLVATNSAGVTNGVIACDGVLPGCEVEIRQDTVNGTGLTLYPKEVIEQDFQTALNRWHVLESNKELNNVTLTVNAAAHSITRSSGDWTDDDNDVQVGDHIAFFGFSNTGNNNRLLVTGISATVIYCNQATTLVNESKTSVWANVWPSNIVTTADHTTQISVTITFTKLVKYSGDDKNNATVTVVPEYRLKAKSGETPNPWITLGTFNNGSNIITRNKAETLRFTATTTVTAGQYEVQVRRQTEDATDSNIQDTIYWTSLRSHTGLDIMPVRNRKQVCILGVKIKSTEAVANCISQLNCMVQADYSYIVAQDTSHDWTSIIASDASNTALAFVHAIMGPGNPRPRLASKLDWDSIYSFAQWCDTLKGLSPNQYRVETNGIVTSSSKLSDLISQILAQGRASLSMSSGKYGIVLDQLQATPKQHIGPHNSWGFRGTKNYAEPIHGYRIKFINKDAEYIVDERIVLDDGYKYDTEEDGVLRDCWGTDRTSDSNYTEATKFESIEANFDSNPAQVFGLGRYLLAVRRLRPELFTVNMDAENLAVQRGELVKVSHPAPLWGLGDGRLTDVTLDESGNITAVTTDNMLTMEAGKNYAVRLRTQTGTSIYRTVATVAGETHTLTLSTVIPAGGDIPESGDWFGFGLAGLETVDCIVMGIALNDDLSAKLTLFEAAPDVHTADSGAIPPFLSKVSFGPRASMPSAKTQVFPAEADPIPYQSLKTLSALTDAVDFDGQYGIYGGIRYRGTMPATWTLDDNSALHAELSNDNQTVTTDVNGAGGDFSFCATTLSIYLGAADDSANWTFAATPSSGITGTPSGTPANRTYTVTAMSTDNGYVDITATRTGYASITKRFSISKSKTGAAGTSPTSYSLFVDVGAVQKSIAGAYTPAAINISAKSTTGGAGPAAYAGRFIIATYDGSSWTDRYTSSANESSKVYTPPASITAIRVRLYLSGGTSALLDEETIPVVSDGAAGSPGANAIVMTSATTPSGTYVGQLGIWISQFYRWTGSAWELYDAVLPTDTPALYYSFDEMSDGMTVIDNSGNNRHGSNYGALPVPCISGKGVSFGGSQYILPERFWQNATALSVSFWAKNNTFVQAASIISDYTWNVNQNLIIGYEDPEGTIHFYIGSGTTAKSIAATGFDTNWHHWAFVYLGGQYMRIYRDGVKVSESTDSIPASMAANYASEYGIGRYAVYYYNGLLDELVMYPRAFSDAEVRGLYLARSLPKQYGISDYQLDQMASDGVITPQEKSVILSRWCEIINDTAMTATVPTAYNGTVADGRFKTLRNRAYSAGTWTPTTDGTPSKTFYSAVEALRAYLFVSPAVLLAANWDVNIAITKSTWLSLWMNVKSTADALQEVTASSDAKAYLGRYNAAHPASYKPGDWWLVYDTDDAPIQRGVWYSNAGTPTRISLVSGETGYTTDATLLGKIPSALADIAWAEKSGFGAAANYGVAVFYESLAAVTAFIDTLYVKHLSGADGTFSGTLNAAVIQSGSAIYSSDGHIAIKGDSTVGAYDEGICFTNYNQKTSSPSGGDILYSTNLFSNSGYSGVELSLHQYGASSWKTMPISHDTIFTNGSLIQHIWDVYTSSTDTASFEMSSSANNSFISLWVGSASYAGTEIRLSPDQNIGLVESRIYSRKKVSTSTSWEAWFTPQANECGLIVYSNTGNADMWGYVCVASTIYLTRLVGTSNYLQTYNGYFQVKTNDTNNPMVFRNLRLQ